MKTEADWSCRRTFDFSVTPDESTYVPNLPTRSRLKDMNKLLLTCQLFLASVTSDTVSHKIPALHQTNRLPFLHRNSSETLLQAMVAKMRGSYACVTFLYISQNTRKTTSHISLKTSAYNIICMPCFGRGLQSI